MINIAIVGHGFVGKGVEYGFAENNLQIIDPALYGNSVDNVNKDTVVSFVCVPTPFGENGEINASIVVDVVEKLLKNNDGLVVIKSTVIPSIVDQLSAKSKRVIYNPEFLTERNAQMDFINPPMNIFGGNPNATKWLEEIYQTNSKCKPAPSYHMTALEASFVKYGINSFLATKVLWFNQYKDLVDAHGGNYDTIIKAIGADPRIGASHSQVPGPDGRRGYGGACFPKDTNALAAFGGDMVSLLALAIEKNNEYRSQYELDDREKEQKVVYKSN